MGKLFADYQTRYRQYAIEKANLVGRGLSPKEYEAEVKRLAKKYRI